MEYGVDGRRGSSALCVSSSEHTTRKAYTISVVSHDTLRMLVEQMGGGHSAPIDHLMARAGNDPMPTE